MKSKLLFILKPLKFLFAVIFLPAIFLGTTFFLNDQGFFNINTIDVQVEEPVDQYNFLKPELAKLKSKLEKYQERSLWDLRLNDVASEMSDDLWIESSRISRSWPSTLAITVKPYKIKFLLVNKNGSLQPVIRDGNMLNPIESSMAPDVILLQGEKFKKDPVLRKKAVELLTEIPAEGSFSSSTISEINFDEKDGFGMKMIKSDLNVRLGDGQFGLKAKRVSQVIDYLEKHEIQAHTIDANLSKKVLVRMHR